MTTDTGKRIIFVGSYMDLFNALQAAREQDAVIDAVNERAADDRPAVDEAPWTVGDCASLAYGTHSLEPDKTKGPCEFGSAAWFAGIPEEEL